MVGVGRRRWSVPERTGRRRRARVGTAALMTPKGSSASPPKQDRELPATHDAKRTATRLAFYTRSLGEGLSVVEVCDEGGTSKVAGLSRGSDHRRSARRGVACRRGAEPAAVRWL